MLSRNSPRREAGYVMRCPPVRLFLLLPYFVSQIVQNEFEAFPDDRGEPARFDVEVNGVDERIGGGSSLWASKVEFLRLTRIRPLVTSLNHCAASKILSCWSRVRLSTLSNNTTRPRSAGVVAGDGFPRTSPDRPSGLRAERPSFAPRDRRKRALAWRNDIARKRVVSRTARGRPRAKRGGSGPNRPTAPARPICPSARLFR